MISQEILLVKWQLDNQEKNTNKYASIIKNLNGILWQYGQNSISFQDYIIDIKLRYSVRATKI